MKWRVPIHGAPNKTIRVDDNATEGAVVGINLRWPDGTVVRVEDILNGDAKTSPSGQPVAPQVPGQGASPPPSQGFAPQLWNLLQGVPPNVRQVELLATSGLVTRKADGTWVTREILTATLDVINADGDAGDVTINLAELTDTGTGALLAIDRDIYGRVEGSRPADFDDIVTALGYTPEAAGAVTDFTATAGGTIHGGRVVRSDNGLIYAVDNTDDTHAAQVVGVALNAATSGNPVTVRAVGYMEDGTWTWANGVIYCGAAGQLTQTAPVTGWFLEVARVVNSTKIFIDLTPVIYR